MIPSSIHRSSYLYNSTPQLGAQRLPLPRRFTPCRRFHLPGDQQGGYPKSRASLVLCEDGSRLGPMQE